MIVRPKPGMLLRHPITREPIPAEGIEVDENDFWWLQRVAHGDVELVDKPGSAEHAA